MNKKERFDEKYIFFHKSIYLLSSKNNF